ncbi:MAG: HAMP domain-containing histidine kinase [Myxococcales bacterium]|nr:HAMP domain-containing histidine kinase [Myxococcales bacterium]
MPLWQIIVDARAELLEAFVHKVAEDRTLRRRVPDDPAPPDVRGLLDQLTVLLRAATVGKNATLLPEARVLAAELGEAGAEEGRDIDEIVSDFLALHEAILDVSDEHEEEISPLEHRALARGINRAIASAVTRYAQARDQELQRAHSEHFAFLAHELRTPLSNIEMGIDLLEEGLDAAALLPRVRRAARRMRELLDNEITSARLSAGSPLHVEPVRLSRLLSTVIDELRMQARDRDIEVSLAVPDDYELQADPRLLRSIFTNLVVNAVKFTKAGGTITIQARHEGDHVVCEVADGCGGLPPKTEASLFAAYTQSGEDRSGFGLGLAIVAEAVALHGGTISVDNRPGEGCTMIVRLPRAPVHTEPPEA